MEVHHHSHAHGNKSWKAYFWEFLMLFLAVFCGFLAENQREHLVEHQREKQYIFSMIEDLETDTSNFSELIYGFEKKETLFDSVILGFNENTGNYNHEWAQKFLRSVRGGFPDFYPTDRTIQQLKNSGGLRLIRNEKAANGIIQYDAKAKDAKTEETTLSILQDRYIEEVMKVWSYNKMLAGAGVTSWDKNKNMEVKNNFWLTNDPIAFEHLFNRLSEFNEAIIRQTNDYKKMKNSAITLINLLKEEYHIK